MSIGRPFCPAGRLSSRGGPCRHQRKGRANRDQPGAHELEVLDELSRPIAHFPVSIARMAEKRPVGGLHRHRHHSQPGLYVRSGSVSRVRRRQGARQEARHTAGPKRSGRVGVDRPRPSGLWNPRDSRTGEYRCTESHGCFRLANWDALTLEGLVQVGMPVIVDE